MPVSPFQSASSKREQRGVAVRPNGSYVLNIKMSGSGIDKYPAKQHARNVASRLPDPAGLIYLQGQKTRLREDSDMEVEFNQRRYFYYLSGVLEPDCALTYEYKTDTLTLYVPDFDFKKAIWTGPTLGIDDALERYDVDQVRYMSTLWTDIASWTTRRAQTSPLYLLHPTQSPPLDNLPPIPQDTTSLLPATAAARTIKDAHELRLIRRALHITTLAHTAVLRNITRFTNERQIHGLFLDTCISHGAPRQAYGVIAASGPNAAVLHYMRNDDALEGKQFVCLDGGAEWDVYASDVTRTFPLRDIWPSEEGKRIYELVQTMQEECIKRVRPGVRFLDLQVLAHTIAIRGLLELGILRQPAGESVEAIRASGASSVFFPHGLGHHVGLEVHDVSDRPTNAAVAATKLYRDTHPSMFEDTRLPAAASAPLLAEGMVVTVEPGIYFSRVAIEASKGGEAARFIDYEVVERYMDVGGVRIEDDVLVTGDGYENLTDTPKGEEALRVIRQGMRERGEPVRYETSYKNKKGNEVYFSCDYEDYEELARSGFFEDEDYKRE